MTAEQLRQKVTELNSLVSSQANVIYEYQRQFSNQEVMIKMLQADLEAARAEARR